MVRDVESEDVDSPSRRRRESVQRSRIGWVATGRKDDIRRRIEELFGKLEANASAGAIRMHLWSEKACDSSNYT